MNAPTLAIKLWRNEISVARDQRAPHAVQARVDEITRAAQQALGAALDAYLQRKAGEVILLRSLEFDFDLDLACDPTRAARALAGHMTQQLVGCIETAAPQVLRFASQAAYAARFVVDIAAGTAWGRWYYDAFDGLRALPTGAAIRSVLADNDATLAAIARDDWPALLDALADAELWRLLDDWAQRPVAGDTSALATPLLAALADRELPAIARAPAIAVRLLASCAGAGLAIDGAAVRAAEVVASVVEAARRGELASIAAPLRGGWPASPGDKAAVRVALHLAGDEGDALRELRAAAQRALAQRAGVTASDTADEAAPLEIASCAPGLAILLGELEGLRVAGLRAPEGFDGALLLAILATASGPQRAGAVWHDAAWRAVLGVDARLSWSVFADALGTAGAALTDTNTALASQAARHGVGPVVRVRCRVEGTASAGLVIEPAVDLATGLWCGLDRCDPADRTAPPTLATRLAATRRARDDWRALDHLLLHDGCPPTWRAAIIGSAQLAWRRIGQRVPGMLLASLPYLRANLLGWRGSVTAVGPARWHWQIGRPPLHVLLAMTGVARPGRLGERQIEIGWR